MSQFQLIKNDVNGNPRYVTSWCGWGFDTYAQAVLAANAIGGRKYNTRAFGGGLVFQVYESELANIAAQLKGVKI